MKNIDTCPYCGENCFEGEGCDEWQADGFNKEEPKQTDENGKLLTYWGGLEEPKQEYEYIGECKGNNGNGCFMDNPAHNCGCFVRKPKQETTSLEEAAERLFHEEKYPTEFKTLRKAFISNAKWQAERMYSEEEVIKILLARNADLGIIGKTSAVVDFFQKFKKK